MITAALLLAGVIIDVSLLHWGISVTVIAITAAIRYHDVHVVMTTRMSFSPRRRLDIVVATSLQRSRQPSSIVWNVVVNDNDG